MKATRHRQGLPLLTDEEVSRVLSAAAVGELYHGYFGFLSRQSSFFGAIPTPCGCVAGTVFNLNSEDYDTVFNLNSEDYDQDDRHIWKISNAVEPYAGDDGCYGGTPDRVLRNLIRARLVKS